MVHQPVSDTSGLVDVDSNIWYLDFRAWLHLGVWLCAAPLRVRTGWEHVWLGTVRQFVQPGAGKLTSRHSYLRLIGCLVVLRQIVQKCPRNLWKGSSSVNYQYGSGLSCHRAKSKSAFSFASSWNVQTHRSFRGGSIFIRTMVLDSKKGRRKIGTAAERRIKGCAAFLFLFSARINIRNRWRARLLSSTGSGTNRTVGNRGNGIVSNQHQ